MANGILIQSETTEADLAAASDSPGTQFKSIANDAPGDFSVAVDEGWRPLRMTPTRVWFCRRVEDAPHA